MAGLGKRPATLVPQAIRTELDKLSKATLMELLWDITLRDEGGSEDRAIVQIRKVNLILEEYR